MDFEAVILAAGMGTRLARPYPKPLTRLGDGQTIIRRQVDHLRSCFGADLRINAVIGFKMDLLIEANPDLAFVYNQFYDTTNTSKSLLKAFQLTGRRGVLWLNGDVVFDARLLSMVRDRIRDGGSFLCVNTASVAEEEVKYTLDSAGHISGLSKSVVNGLGEAVGINFVAAADKSAVQERLEDCADEDYFERGLELAIEHDGVRIRPVDISGFSCVEVDFADDLDRANEFVGRAGE